MEPVSRRVVLTGSESTGKTTLAVRLARHYGTSWVPEFARAYAELKGGPLTVADVERIARGQLAAEERALARGPGLVVLDTDIVSTVVYAEHYYGACPAWVREAALERQGDLYLLLAPDLPWTADPVRDRPRQREEMHALFRRALENVGARFVEIAGAGDARFRAAVEAVERLQRR